MFFQHTTSLANREATIAEAADVGRVRYLATAPARLLILIVALAGVLTACGRTAGDATAATVAEPLVKASSDTTMIHTLDGSTVAGSVYVYVREHPLIDDVAFYLDDENRVGAPAAVEESEPYAFEIDTTALDDGQHTLTAMVRMSKGPEVQLHTAAFTVANESANDADDGDGGQVSGPTVPADPSDPAVPGAPTDPSDPTEPTDPSDPADPTEPTQPGSPAPDPAEADWFVAPDGRFGADGTLDDPFYSIEDAVEAADPGDLILLRDGVYDDVGEQVYVSLRFSGTEDAPITIRSYPGERAIFDGSQHDHYPRRLNDGHDLSNPRLLYYEGEYVVWEDLTFRNGVGRTFFAQANHSVFRNIEAYDNHSDGIHLRGSYNLLEHIHSHHNVSTANGGNSADGIKIEDPRDGNRSRGNVVRFGDFHHNSDDGIDIWNSYDTVVEYSVAHNNGVGATGNGVGFKMGCPCTHESGSIARFNVGYENRLHNFSVNSGGGIALVNNTSFGSVGSYGFVLRNQTDTDYNNVSKNNLSFDDSKAFIGDGLTVDVNNSWSLGTGDPEFASTDPGADDFLALASDSPAIDSGVDIGYDYEGDAPDLGALEAGTTLADTTRGLRQFASIHEGAFATN